MNALEKFDLDHLSMLWLASVRNPELRSEIEQELQNRISINNNFSREYLFKISKVLNRALGVFFIPASDAFNLFGEYITVDLILSDGELVELATNYSSNPPKNTSGQLRAHVLVTDMLSPDQVKMIAEQGFHTNDILKVQYL